MICAKCLRPVDVGAHRCPTCQGDPFVLTRYRLDRQLRDEPDAAGYRATRLEDGLLVRAFAVTLRHSPPGGPSLADVVARMRALRHPALPLELEFGLEPDIGQGRARLWLIRERVRGETLAARLHGGVEQVREAGFVVRVLLGVAEALVYLHARRPPVVHGCISATTILVREQARASSNACAISLLDLFHPAASKDAPSPATDVRALGRVGAALLELDTSAWHPAHATALAALVERMLEPDPSGRITSAEVRDKLVELEATLAAPASPAVTQRELRSPPTAARAATPGPRFMMIEPSTPSRPSRPAALRERSLNAGRQRTTSRSLGSFHGHHLKPRGPDIPIMRPEELSRELSQAYQATAALQDRQRKRLGVARVLVVLIAAMIAALTTYLAIRI